MSKFLKIPLKIYTILKSLIKLWWHSVRTLFLENRAVETLLEKEAEEKLDQFLTDRDIDAYKSLVADLDKLQEIDIHYKKKENLFFPYMEKYGFTTPPQVM